jgi:hypothetical protein
MADDRPAWRQGFDAIEAAVAPRLEGLVQSEPFQIAAGLVSAAQKDAQRRVERTMRRALHLWNLPAGSDVTRILNEIGKLQRDVRELSRRVDERREEGSDGSNGHLAAGSPRPRSS